MREIGGYIELESYKGNMFHDGALTLNLGRSALAYIIEARHISKIAMPYFMCDSCEKILNNYNVSVRKYEIGTDFVPLDIKLNQDEWLYIVNYYGQLDNCKLKELENEHQRIIVDNTQSYFQEPLQDVDTIYSCRKYFGVPDGAFLYTTARLDYELEQDESYERMHHLLGRYERSANKFYNEYVKTEHILENVPLMRMSKLTYNLLHGIDYEYAIRQRRENFDYLHKAFHKINHLDLIVPYGPFMYPLYVDNGGYVRKKLQERRIYIPCLWPNVVETCDKDSRAYKYAVNILPIPVDQRYSLDDIKYIEETINVLMSMEE